MARIAACSLLLLLLLLLALVSACPSARTDSTRPAAPSSGSALEIRTYSETQPYTSLAVLNDSLYAGTPTGVVRFDLRSRKHTRLTRAEGLPGNQVFALSGHPASGLWVATNGGISRFHEGAWTNIPPAPGDRAVSTMVATADGVWVGGARGLARLFGTQWKRFLPGAHVTVLRADVAGAIWVGTEGEGIYQARGDSLASQAQPQGQPLRFVKSLAFTREGGLIAVGRDDRHEHGLAFFDGRYWTAIRVEPSGHLYWAEQVGDQVMLAYNDRILALHRIEPGESEPAKDAKSGRGVVTLTSTRSPLAPPATPIPRFSTRDVERWLPTEPTVVLGHGRRIFMGTRTAGAAAFDGQHVTWYRARDLTAGNERLHAACVSGAGCYLACGGRALRLGPEGFVPVSVDNDPSLRVQAFSESPSGLLVLSVAGDGQTVVASQLAGSQFTRLFESKLLIPAGRVEIRFARVAPDGKIWAGLTHVDPKGSARSWGIAILGSGIPPVYHRSTLLPDEERGAGSLALPDDIRDVLFAGDDTWFSTSSGICRVRGSKVDLFTENEGLESELVYALARGPNGQLYAGSHGGVGHYDGKWWRFDMSGPLTSPTRALVPRGEQLWAATDAGLVGWSAKGTRLISSRQGLAADRVLDLYLEAGRRMWVLTEDGLSILTL